MLKLGPAPRASLCNYVVCQVHFVVYNWFMEQIATMTIKHEIFDYADLASLKGRQFTLDYPDFGCHVYEIRGIEQSDPIYLNLTCVVLDAPLMLNT
jgi:hypothetical protein